MASNKRQPDIRDYIKGAKSGNKASSVKGKNTRSKQQQQRQQQPQIDRKLADEILTKISIHRGSITDLRVDCIVNAANGGLWAGAGVCGAIFRAAGYGSLQRECDGITDKLGNIPTGESVITKGYKLNANYIIHSVGPTSQNNKALQNCYRTALELCIQHNIRSIAFPCISTGIFGFSKQVAAPLALKTVRAWLIMAKKTKYKDYMKRIEERQKLKIQEALKRKKNRYRYRGYGDDDSDNDDDDDDEWDEDEDKNKNKKGGDNDDNTTQKDKKEIKDKNGDKNEQKEDKSKEETQNGDDKKKNEDTSNKMDEDEQKGGDKNNNNNNGDKQNDDNNDDDNDDDDDDETIFDRMDDIVFCCYDIGNWHLYEDKIPIFFSSTDDDHSYLWRDKLKAKKKAIKKKQTNKKVDSNNSNNKNNKNNKSNSNNKDNKDNDMDLVDSEGSDNDD